MKRVFDCALIRTAIEAKISRPADGDERVREASGLPRSLDSPAPEKHAKTHRCHLTTAAELNVSIVSFLHDLDCVFDTVAKVFCAGEALAPTIY